MQTPSTQNDLDLMNCNVASNSSFKVITTYEYLSCLYNFFNEYNFFDNGFGAVVF